MAHSSTTTLPRPRTFEPVPPPPNDPKPEAMKMGTTEAAKLIGVNPRTIERWVDNEQLRGGRPRDPHTGQALKGTHRWVDAEHVVLIMIGANRTHLVPDQWKHLIPRKFRPRKSRSSQASTS